MVVVAARALAIVLACVCVLLAVPSPASAQTLVAGDLTFTQDFVSDTKGVADTFTYEITADSADAPLPEGASNGTYTFTMTGTDTVVVNFQVNEPSADSVYTYTARQVTPADADGYTYDDTVYTIKFYVYGNSATGYIFTYDEQGDKVHDPGWTITYAQPVVTSPSSPTTPTTPEAATQAATVVPVSDTQQLVKTGDAVEFGVLLGVGIAAVAVACLGLVVRLRGRSR
jgi:hypothetical protein